MTSAPARDPLADHLITPQNAALLLIDYQPAQVASDRISRVKPRAVARIAEIRTRTATPTSTPVKTMRELIPAALLRTV